MPKSNVKTIGASSSLLRWLAGVSMIAPATLIVVGLFVYPFMDSLIGSFQNAKSQWTLDNYLYVIETYHNDFLFTLVICLVSLVLVLALAALLAGWLRLKADPFVEFLFKIPLFVPFVVVGHAMRVFLAPHGTLNSLLASTGWFNPDVMPSVAFSTTGLIVALVWKNIGLTLLLVMGAFRGINSSYLEAARNTGAGGFRLIKDMMIPMSWGTISVAGVLTFTSMIGNFSIPAMLGDAGGSQMLMIDLYYELVYRHDSGAANAIGVVSYIASMGAAIYYVKKVAKS
ncbi:sugar ABC transporter permease [Paenibacillus alba]|uniref:ABC transporter permease subunit n=1 Tax=Paenibacillus alba TaxID=1197127 RepID=UPI00156471F9|nr:sugar ABC transporter permease [Paenibacillus alba]